MNSEPVTTPQPRAPTLKHPLAATVLLAGATGARGMLGVAATSRALARVHSGARVQPARALTGPRARAATTAFTTMELIGDKLPGVPNRIDAGPIAARALSGALIGAVIGELAGRNRAASALIGAASAVIGAHITFRLRQRLTDAMPPLAAALAEDAIVTGIASVGVAALREDR